MADGVDFAVFDADNHLYESEDALTRYLPATHRNLIRFVELGGRKKLVVHDRLTEFIPNPTSEVVARPGAHMAFYAGDNPDGKSLRELTGAPMACIPAFREPIPPSRRSPSGPSTSGSTTSGATPTRAASSRPRWSTRASSTTASPSWSAWSSGAPGRC
jgi:hypothetical protein